MRMTYEQSQDKALQRHQSILKIKSKSTQKLFKVAMNNISKFGKVDLKNLQMYDEDDIFDLLQEWVIWNNESGMATSTIMCYLNSFRSYVRCFRIKLDWHDIQHNLTFPQLLHQEPAPISYETIEKILGCSQREFRFQLLGLISSGMRASELGQIRTEHMDFRHSNIMVRLPPQITKTGRSRITFFSRQVSDMIRYRIKKNGSESFSFCGNRTQEQARDLILKRFSVARRKTGLVQKHNHCNQNRYMVHVHSLRSYFITRANKTQFGIGHILAGHDFYMKEYNQYTVEEMLDMYRKFEKDLTFRS